MFYQIPTILFFDFVRRQEGQFIFKVFENINSNVYIYVVYFYTVLALCQQLNNVHNQINMTCKSYRIPIPNISSKTN